MLIICVQIPVYLLIIICAQKLYFSFYSKPLYYFLYLQADIWVIWVTTMLVELKDYVTSHH